MTAGWTIMVGLKSSNKVTPNNVFVTFNRVGSSPTSLQKSEYFGLPVLGGFSLHKVSM